jgi:hypothetical protein
VELVKRQLPPGRRGDAFSLNRKVGRRLTRLSEIDACGNSQRDTKDNRNKKGDSLQS